MATTRLASVDEYLAAQPAAARAILEKVRRILRKAVPGAEEVISYQIPALKRDGGAVIYFAGWKEHYSLYPATRAVVTAFKQALAPYEVSKGTIRFPLAEAIPAKLIEGIAKLRAKETAEGAKAKASMKKTTKKAASNTSKKSTAKPTTKTAKKATAKAPRTPKKR